jgi:hypothetical protein
VRISLRKKRTGKVSKNKSKAATKFPGRVEKVIHPQPQTGEPEKAQIAVEGADHLYKEIRVPNRLVDDNGEKVKLKPGAEVDVTIEAEPNHTTAASKEEGS